MKRVLYADVILQWQDTELFSYPDLADGQQILEVTDDEWENQAIYKSVVDGQLSKDEPPTSVSLDDLKTAKIAEIDQAYSVQAGQLAAGYPDQERESWPVQVMEAYAILHSTGTATPWIDAAAQARGITAEDMANKISAMDIQYRGISGALTGKRQALRDQIDAATTADQVASVVW